MLLYTSILISIQNRYGINLKKKNLTKSSEIPARKCLHEKKLVTFWAWEKLVLTILYVLFYQGEQQLHL